MKTLFLGIDPGAAGGIAIVGQGFAQAWKLTSERESIDLLRTHAPAIAKAYLENVQGFPGSRVDSAVKLAISHGVLRGLLVSCEIDYELIWPRVWQRRMGCMTKGDKNVSKSKAQELWPELRITHAIADALLLAECCRRESQGTVEAVK